MASPWFDNLRRFRSDNAGVAAVEFGLIAPLFVLALGIAVDCALVYRTKLRLISASLAATQFVLKKSGALTGAAVPGFIEDTRAVVTFVAGSPRLKTTVLVNNAASAINLGDYYCVSGTSPETWTWSSTGATQGSCGTTKAGKYLTIVVEASPQTFFTPAALAAKIVNVRDYVIVGIN